jgi:hypothetical protein
MMISSEKLAKLPVPRAFAVESAWKAPWILNVGFCFLNCLAQLNVTVCGFRRPLFGSAVVLRRLESRLCLTPIHFCIIQA